MAPSSSTQIGKASTREDLLSVLRGQNLRVPDLALMHAGWPKDTNPHVEAIDVKILQLIETHAVNETVRSRLTKANLSEQLAGWYPYASREKLDVLTSFQVWMFIIDDLLDQYSIVEQFDYEKLQALLNDCEDYVERSLGVSSQEIEPSSRYLDHDAVLSFEEQVAANIEFAN
ncbi:epi-isozizaene synthase [Fusarium bulbicola]|nr:epi-isozizaene synthase [Fusarium bulbicola]